MSDAIHQIENNFSITKKIQIKVKIILLHKTIIINFTFDIIIKLINSKGMMKTNYNNENKGKKMKGEHKYEIY